LLRQDQIHSEQQCKQTCADKDEISKDGHRASLRPRGRARAFQLNLRSIYWFLRVAVRFNGNASFFAGKGKGW
jgi:hypothetical protein